MKRIAIICFIILCIYHIPTYALSGFSISYGTGNPSDLRGGRASLTWDWHSTWLKSKAVNITGYWDVSTAYWSTDGNEQGNDKSAVTFAASPIFRIIPNTRYQWLVTPYLEFGIGAAIHTSSFLGTRNLGSHFAFQDLLGLGFAFGKKREFSLSYHYLHYSNARIAPPNEGIDVKYLIQMMYRFG